MPRQPEQVKVALANAAERRRELHTAMVRGEMTVDRYRELAAFESRWIDRLLDDLLASRVPA